MQYLHGALFLEYRKDFYGIDTTDTCDSSSCRWIAEMGLQPRLGLCTKRRLGNCIAHCGHPNALGTAITHVLSIDRFPEMAPLLLEQMMNQRK